MSETEQIEQIKTWLAGRYQDHHIYRGKPKLLAKHAQELLDELVTPLLAERTRERDEARAELARIDRDKADAITDAVASWQQRVASLEAELAGLRAEQAEMLADFEANDETNLADAQTVDDENKRLRAELAAAVERGDAEARCANTRAEVISQLKEDLRQARAEAVRVMEHAEKSMANVRVELAGLRERAVILPEDAATQLADAASWTIWRDALPAARDAFAHLIESWRAAPEPATPPKVDYCGRCGVVRVKLSDGTCTTCAWKNHPLPEPAAPADREWHLCHNAGSHHITDTFHGNDCDRPEHWDEVERGDGK